ncbi:MAG: sodium/glutamate symporter family protein [Planctomycetota bacterium]
MLEPRKRSARSASLGALQCGVMVWIIVVGEIILGLAAMWILMQGTDLPVVFGQLLEAGFAGGHGTATALGTMMGEVAGFEDALDLGMFVATIGLVYSVISGIALVNLGLRKGWTNPDRADMRLIGGLEARSNPTPAAYARVRGEVVDPLAFQGALVGLALLLGYGLQQGFVALCASLPEAPMTNALGNVPLFLFALIGGWGLRHAMNAIGLGDLIDGESVKRVVAIAMEFLIVAAMASLRLEVVATYGWPLLVLVLVGCVWTGFCLIVLSRFLLPASHWFELGLINYGMSTGTTAQGMMLLRIVDRDLDSGAAEDYALAAPLSAPFVGGGVITLSLPLLVMKAGIPLVVGLGLLAIGLLLLIGRWLKTTEERRNGAER